MTKRRRKIECLLPTYQQDHQQWRKEILANVRDASAGVEYDSTDELEVVVLLYLNQRKQLGIHDVDNRLKDILDALQGLFGSSRASDAEWRLIENDNQICRVLIEKQKIPKKFGDDADNAGGRLLIRPNKPHRWPLQSTKASRQLRKRKPSA